MRIRITRSQIGDVDGIDLSSFHVGMTYEVSSSIGSYLVAMDAADVVSWNEPLGALAMNELRLAQFIERARDRARQR